MEVRVAFVALHADAPAQDTRAAQVLLPSARQCSALGLQPFPLDLENRDGGALAVGGPPDDEGRFLVRESFALLDLHDGRKKLTVGG